MPRTLPWLVKKGKADPAPKRNVAGVGRQPKATPPETANDAKTPKDKPIDIEEITTEPYDEGPTGDDQWRMVEDELLFTAQEFTKSIHKAELERLQKEAVERPKDTLRSLDSLLAAAPVAQTRKRKVSRMRVESPDASSDDDMLKDDDAFKKTKLGSLMASPRRAIRNLTQLEGVRGASKAEASNSTGKVLFKGRSPPTGDTTDDGENTEEEDLDGHVRSGEIRNYSPDVTIRSPDVKMDDTTEDDDDDLDMPVFEKRGSPMLQRITAPYSSRAAASVSKTLIEQNQSSTSTKPTASSTQPSKRQTSRARRPDTVDDLDDDFYNDLLGPTLKHSST
ncbi:hypothetical protein BJ508DRAFT_311963 [Ascobolus immersus RN42]|uniref:Uncharacterized protein n=1 Tax=Ascobolus immersus RN42 TaxID=1160509 RepID=A0A3N4HSI9_ASCIM|nr:hypothetical protein BJ508DRAFT_311963 [Ascobolus immersus RN42]